MSKKVDQLDFSQFASKQRHRPDRSPEPVEMHNDSFTESTATADYRNS